MDTVYIKTFGCSNNFHESEVMVGLLKKEGYKVIYDHDKVVEAGCIILNICTVKGDNVALKEIRKVNDLYPAKALIIAGCVPKETQQEILKLFPNASFISTHNIKHISEVVNEALGGGSTEMLDFNQEVKICLPKVRMNPVISIIPIASGCMSSCNYCSVKLIKGELMSFPKEMILEEVNKSVRQGCKEIFLTAQDTAVYGQDIGCTLPDLLKDIVKIEGNYLIRLGMANPAYVLKYLDELIEVFKNKHMYKFIHIPVQSGNNEILAKMNRKYTVTQFKKIVNKFRKEIPMITIATDIICGYPGETKKQFEDSVKLVEYIKPDVLNISRYVKRNGTVAGKLRSLKNKTVKERSQLLTEKFHFFAFEQNMKWKNWEGNVLIDEVGKEGTGTMIGRNYGYRPVIVEGEYKLGEILRVKVLKITKFDLRAVIIK